jgi:hypothetical protein
MTPPARRRSRSSIGEALDDESSSDQSLLDFDGEQFLGEYDDAEEEETIDESLIMRLTRMILAQIVKI